VSLNQPMGVDKKQVSAPDRRQGGGAGVAAVSDGYFKLPDAVRTGVGSEDVAATFRDAFLPPLGSVRYAIKAFLVNDGCRLTLINAGACDLIPTGRGLTANLARLGGRSEDVYEVLVRHMHPDHMGG
jgi:hypothetical protein